MNDYEIEQAEYRYQLHPVLGPATRTLGNLMRWTNANSDGWVYWRQPFQAAQRLIELVEQGIRHDREAYQHPRTPEVTAEQYKATLRAVRAFRTRQENQRLGRRPLFEICEPVKPADAGVWAAQQAVDDAAKMHAEAATREQAARELLNRAKADLDRARYRQNLSAQRMTEVRDEKHPGCLVRPGSEFIPEA
jgi:hypothetical protein